MTHMNERPFVDRDPEIFKHILYFLEYNRLPTLTDKSESLLLDEELDYWALSMPSAELQLILEKQPSLEDDWAVK